MVAIFHVHARIRRFITLVHEKKNKKETNIEIGLRFVDRARYYTLETSARNDGAFLYYRFVLIIHFSIRDLTFPCVATIIDAFDHCKPNRYSTLSEREKQKSSNFSVST